MKNRAFRIWALFLCLGMASGGFSAPAAADGRETSAVRIPMNESREIYARDAGEGGRVFWTVRDPAGDRDLRLAEGNPLTVNYAMAERLLTGGGSAVFLAHTVTGSGPETAPPQEFTVTFTEPLHDPSPVSPPRPLPDRPQRVEPAAGFLSDGEGGTPYPDSPEETLAVRRAFLDASTEEEADSLLDGLTEAQLRRLEETLSEPGDPPDLSPAQRAALAGHGADVSRASGLSAPVRSAPKALSASPPDGMAERTPGREVRASGAAEEGSSVRLEVEYRYQDENGADAGVIAPGWYLDNPDGTTAYTVTFHAIAGYKATVDGADQTFCTFTPAGGAYVPAKITVVYVPQEVSYTVRLFRETLDGTYEGVTLSEEHKAKTGSLIGMQALCDACRTDGFGDPWYREIPRVKGDGSAVAEIRMDRRYYLMDFVLGEGGYGVEPVYAKYGAAIPAAETPTRPGYVFQKWELNGEDATIPVTMPAENRKYVADWTMKTPAAVTVNIWGEEANSEDYELIGSETVQAVSGSALTRDELNTGLTGVNADLWEYGRTEPDQLPDVSPDGSTVVNVYYRRTLKTLTFNPVGGTMTRWTAGETKAENWADGGNESDRRPKWNEDYTWTYGSSSYPSTVNVQALQTYLNEEYPAPQEGNAAVYSYKKTRFQNGTMHFVFHNGAWYVGEEQEVPAEPFSTITAKWGSNIADEWDAACEAGSCHNWSEKTNGDSPWTSGVRVMFDRDISYYKGSDSGGGTCQATYWGEKLNAPGEYEILYTATADGSDLIVSDEDRLQFEGFTYEKGTSNGSSYGGAKFYYTRNTYKVIYVNSPNPNHEEQAKFQQPLDQDPYNSHTPGCPSNLEPGMYTFGGWHEDPTGTVETVWAGKTMPAKNITVYAKWIPITHAVTFRPDETDPIPETHAAVVAHNALIPASAVPTYEKTNFDFVGWFYKVGEDVEHAVEHAFKPDEMPVRSDMNLYARWKAESLYQYTVNYVLQGSGTPVAEPAVGIGEPGAEFTVSARKGYSAGHPSELSWEYWQFFTPTRETETFTLDEDHKIITFYYEEETAAITYVPVAEEKGVVSPAAETVGKVTGAPQGSVPTPAENCRFAGWYTDEDCTQPVPESWVDPATGAIKPQPTTDAGVPGTDTSTLPVFEDRTYYARFEENAAGGQTLTITKTVTDGKVHDGNDIFVFKITGPDTAMELTILASELVNGTKSVGIRGLGAGTYTVTEDTGWSWRYRCSSPGESASQAVTLEDGGSGDEVTFTNELSDEKWLNASARAVNTYGGGA